MSEPETKWSVTRHEHKGYTVLEQSHIWYEKIENRNKDPKRRQYGAKVRFVFQVIERKNARGDSLVWGAPFENMVNRFFPDARIYADNDYSYEDRKTPVVNVGVAFVVKAMKPSAILPLSNAKQIIQETVNKRLSSDQPIAGWILQAIREALDVKIEEMARRQRRDDADRLARYLAKKAHEGAKKIINYDAELAALEKKLEVTRKQQLVIEIEQLQSHNDVNFEGREVDQRSIVAAIKHASEAFPSETFFGDVAQRDLTKIEEV